MQQLPGLLDQGRLDVVFLRPPMLYPEGIDNVVLLHDRFVLAVHQDSTLNDAGGAIDPASLAGASFIVPEQEFGTAQVGQRGGFTPCIAARPGSLVAVLAEVSLGAGCAVLPQSVVGHISLPGVCYRDIGGAPIESQIAAAFRRHEKSPAALALIAQIKKAAL